MNAPDECPLTQQAVGWALHALEPDEEMAVLLHMPQCAACRAAAHDAEQVLSGLAGVVPLVEPPAGLRQRLMAEVAETPQRPHVLRPLPPQPAPSDVPEPATAPRLHRLDAEDAGSVRRGWFGQGSRSRRLVAASLAVAAAISIGALVVRTNQLEQQRDAESAQAQSLSRLITELGEPDSRYALLADATTVVGVVGATRPGSMDTAYCGKSSASPSAPTGSGPSSGRTTSNVPSGTARPSAVSPQAT